jgi:hypothetical protein
MAWTTLYFELLILCFTRTSPCTFINFAARIYNFLGCQRILFRFSLFIKSFIYWNQTFFSNFHVLSFLVDNKFRKSRSTLRGILRSNPNWSVGRWRIFIFRWGTERILQGSYIARGWHGFSFHHAWLDFESRELRHSPHVLRNRLRHSASK